MKKYHFFIIGLLLAQGAVVSHATICPDPETTSLRWGVPPEPWRENPFSSHPPQGEANTRFVRANILVAGYGQGVLCTYENSLNEYSIWWPVRTKIPSRMDSDWIDTLGGFVCVRGLDTCQFSVAP